jgi:hypothetical protein
MMTTQLDRETVLILVGRERNLICRRLGFGIQHATTLALASAGESFTVPSRPGKSSCSYRYSRCRSRIEDDLRRKITAVQEARCLKNVREG